MAPGGIPPGDHTDSSNLSNTTILSYSLSYFLFLSFFLFLSSFLFLSLSFSFFLYLSLSLTLSISLFLTLYLFLSYSLLLPLSTLSCSIAPTTTAIFLLTTCPSTCLSLYLSPIYCLNSLSLSFLLLLLLLPSLSIYPACPSTVSLYALSSSSCTFALLASCSLYTTPITTCLYIQRPCPFCSFCSTCSFSCLHRSSAILYF
jgi:hypothetical protein